MKKIVALFILFSVPCLLKSQNGEVRKLIYRNQFEKALILSKAHNANAKDKESLLLFGAIYNSLNKPDSALMFLDKIPVDDQDYLDLSEKTISYALINNQEELKTACAKLYTICSSTKKSEIRMRVIEVFLHPAVNKLDYVSELLEKFRELESGNAKFYMLNAQYMLATKKIGEAVTELQRSTYYDSLNAVPYYMLGKIYQTSNPPLSAESFNKSLLRDSLFYPSIKELGEIYYDRGKNEKAIEYFKKFCDNNVMTQKDSLKLASMYLLNKQLPEAEALNNKVFETNPNNVYSLRLNAYINLEMDKNIDQALKSIEKMFSLMDTSQVIAIDYECRGRLYGKLKNDSMAIVCYNGALDKDSSRIINYEYIAKAYENLKNNVKAAEYYEKSISRKERAMSSDYFFLGKNYYIIASKPIDSLLLAFPEKVKADSLQKIEYLTKADTTFGNFISLSPKSYLGYFWKARIKGMFDPETTEGLALPYYQQALSIIEAKPEKYKNDIIESCRYIAYYYFLQYEKYKKVNDNVKSEEMRLESAKYWQRIIDLNPADKTAVQALKQLGNK